MIPKQEVVKRGIKIIDSKEPKNALFENLKTHFPQTIKDNQVDLKAIATLLGLETKANIQGYELTFTGKALANALYSTPTQKLLKFEESFNVRNTESSKEDSNFIEQLRNNQIDLAGLEIDLPIPVFGPFPLVFCGFVIPPLLELDVRLAHVFDQFFVQGRILDS